MDPYLERPSLWPDVHLGLIRAVQAALAPQVAPRYYVAVEERTYIAAIEPLTYLGRPDVAIISQPWFPPAPPLSGPPRAVLERPVIVELPVTEEVRERYLEVREAATHAVVTVVEILSPANKRPGEGRRQYEEKRNRVLEPRTSLVEIDLLRGGEPLPMGWMPTSHYRILVGRGWERPRARLYPFNVNEPIPEIPIPLQRGEAEPTLNLGELLAQIYDQVRYDLRIDYTAEPDPPLDTDTAAWARSLLNQAQRR
jgi:hypothetical protein